MSRNSSQGLGYRLINLRQILLDRNRRHCLAFLGCCAIAAACSLARFNIIPALAGAR